MLTDGQRSFLGVVITMIEEKMKAVEWRMAHPEEQGLTFEIRNDLTPDMAGALHTRVEAVYALVRVVRDRLMLPREVRYATRDILKGLPQLWVALQESDSKSLGRYGSVDPALGPVLDPRIGTLACLLSELQDIVLPGDQERSSSGEVPKRG
ncbi:MAG: hypothetical protein AB1411_09145 [Nitrospirota bacterium]